MLRSTPRLLRLPLFASAVWFSHALALAQWDDPEITTLTARAEKEDVEAMVALADRYRWLGTDDLMEEGWRRARPWLEKAALKGSGYAAMELAKNAREPANGAPDWSTALRWTRLAAEAGYVHGQFVLGEMYELGQGVEENLKEAAKWYLKAAEGSDPESQYRVGAMYAAGRGLPQDPVKAAVWLQKARSEVDEAWSELEALREANPDLAQRMLAQAPPETQELLKQGKAGNAQAQRKIAELFRVGDGGLPVDDRMANEWLRKAAEQGDGAAQVALGNVYYDGMGLERDIAEAKRWLTKAASQGQAGAYLNLGNILLEEQGEGDWNPAIDAWRKGAKLGDRASMEKLAEGLSARGQATGDYGDVMSWYVKLAESGDTASMMHLASLAMLDDPKLRDLKLARHWLEKAEKAGLTEAAYLLGAVESMEKPVTVAAAPTAVPTVVPAARPDPLSPIEVRFQAALAAAGNATARLKAVEDHSREMARIGRDSGVPKVQVSERVFKILLQRAEALPNEIGPLVFAVDQGAYDEAVLNRMASPAAREATRAHAQQVARAFEAKQKALGPIQPLIPRAQGGDDAAAYQIGEYLLRDHAAKDADMALRYLEPAANRGHAGARRLAGQILHEKGMTLNAAKEYLEAFTVLNRAAAFGDSNAMTLIGAYYLDGHGVPRSFELAREWLDKAKALGNPHVDKVLAVLNRQASPGEGLFQEGMTAYQKNEYEAARTAWEKSAAENHLASMHNLGVLYENGSGVGVDLSRALAWYEKAVAQGMENAKPSVSRTQGKIALAEGDKMLKQTQVAEAKALYEKAASLGSAEAMMRIANLYYTGNGTPRDYALAADWYERASKAGMQAAETYRILARANLNGLEELTKGEAALEVMELAEGARLLEMAAEKGNPKAMVRLAEMYKEADGVPRDVEKAKRWFKKAADLGDTGAQMELSLIESSGSLYALYDSQGEMKRLRNNLEGKANRQYGQNVKGPKSGIKNLRLHRRWSMADVLSALRDGADHDYLAAVLHREHVEGMNDLDLKRMMRTPEGQRIDPYGRLRNVLGENATQGAGEWAIELANAAVAKRRSELGKIPRPVDSPALRQRAATGDLAAIFDLYELSDEERTGGPLPETSLSELAEKVIAAKYVRGYWLVADTLRNNSDKARDDLSLRARYLYEGAAAGERRAMRELAIALAGLSYAGVSRNLIDAEYWFIEASARTPDSILAQPHSNTVRDAAFLYSFGVPYGGPTMGALSVPDEATLRWAREMINRGGPLAEVAEISLEELESEGDHKDLRGAIARLSPEGQRLTDGEVQRLDRLARGGDANAALKLGTAYASGRGLRQHDFKATEYLHLAAESGDVRAMRLLANRARDGFGAPQDFNARLAWLEKAGRAGDSDAWREMGDALHYLSNEPTRRQDFPRALLAYEQAAKAGDGAAMQGLALMHRYGRGVPKDEAKAREWNKKGAEAGNMYSQVDYAKALLAERNFAEAANWFGRAADAGIGGARVSQGEALIRAGDLDGAREALEKVLEAEPGDYRAHLLLGQLYEARGDKKRARSSYLMVTENPAPENFYRQEAQERMNRLDTNEAGGSNPPNSKALLEKRPRGGK